MLKLNSWCHEHMRWCLWAWLSIRWRVIPFQGSQWLWIQASKLQSSGLLITVVLILDDPHTPETLHCQLDVLGEPYHCQSFFQQKKSFQKVSSPKLHQKNANFASETTKTQAEHEPSNGSHESWAQIRWILWADLDLEGSGEYTLIWQIYGKYHIVHNLSKVYLNWIAVFHPAVE